MGIAAKLGNKAKVAIKRLGKKMLVAIKFLTIFAAGAVAPAFLIPLFLEDNHSKNKATAKSLSKLGVCRKSHPEIHRNFFNFSELFSC